MAFMKKSVVLLFSSLLGLFVFLFVITASRVGPVEIYLVDAPSPKNPQPNVFRFVNLNMLHGFPDFRELPARLDLIIEELERLKVDAVCLQEVPWTRSTGSTAAILSDILNMNYAYLPANGNRKTILFAEGVAILSAYPIKDVQFTELSPHAGFFEHRVALSARVITPNGAIRVVCTHLTNGESEINFGQVQSLYDFTVKFYEPLIIAGDFNAREDEPQILNLQEKWTDVYRATHPFDPGLTCCIDDLHNPDDPMEERIDYVYMSQGKDINILASKSEVIFASPYRVGSSWLWASDHAGLYAEFDLKR
jgi:endonuclease/exonuclease/phosphatase family metal-dependent hydrolase